ncbi:hypothetical protein Kpol_1070p10 [Vanderwaltozyma polyspora DSM 70294]|uniref:Sporulation-specific protein SPO7 n=1 Tax=Vanderwaltozyma polyspora (strain ATCC 22028 / DSM 70294 / BCRC 21397 / CBS 2163 / NBRC 10782 / NRRL Y-8283 / UCD 57-17) TaxID=436907 RepID=A7TNL1_VANPO|nr:uncharacterized protein Kpol_1070p10 [Vanderwaltozyma polyspora DSM 70294]EDO16128.1 hypothetical protein Kpol_1070p10 [Vanderwaltozyma polyspora DSM 70294]
MEKEVLVTSNLDGYLTPSKNTVRKRSNSKASSGRGNIKTSNDISPASMIFRNLLILEDDLRRQAREQKILKWKFTIFLTFLFAIATYSIYALYFDNERFESSRKGLPRSVLKMGIIFIVVTFVLFHLSGEYRRTIVIPRKFFNITNKGIRQFNVKVVKVENSINDYIIDIIRYLCRLIARIALYTLRSVFYCKETNFMTRFFKNVKIRSQPRVGAVDVKLVLNPRAFSSEIREGWEIYRDEFWAREGARRRKTSSEGKTEKKK